MVLDCLLGDASLPVALGVPGQRFAAHNYSWGHILGRCRQVLQRITGTGLRF